MEITGKGDFQEAEFSFIHLQRTSQTCHSSTVQIYRAFSCRCRGGRGQLEYRIVRAGGYLYCPYGQLAGLVNFMVTLSLHSVHSFIYKKYWTSVMSQTQLQTLVINREQGGRAEVMDSHQQAVRGSEKGLKVKWCILILQPLNPRARQ